jgi:hypothetical protein
MTASIGECSSGACTNVKKVPKAKKVRPQMAMPIRCTFVALGKPFHSKASTLTKTGDNQKQVTDRTITYEP